MSSKIDKNIIVVVTGTYLDSGNIVYIDNLIAVVDIDCTRNQIINEIRYKKDYRSLNGAIVTPISFKRIDYSNEFIR